MTKREAGHRFRKPARPRGCDQERCSFRMPEAILRGDGHIPHDTLAVISGPSKCFMRDHTADETHSPTKGTFIQQSS